MSNTSVWVNDNPQKNGKEFTATMFVSNFTEAIDHVVIEKVIQSLSSSIADKICESKFQEMLNKVDLDAVVKLSVAKIASRFTDEIQKK